MDYKILKNINFPEDLKGLSLNSLTSLSKEIRDILIKKISATGGHFGSNLGMVEATIALHYVFNSPKDKIIFDGSHQCYTHKILTGRKEGFLNPDKYNTLTGYTNPKESNHDFFTIGHGSTSISLALGLCKGRDINGNKENIIAVIGDGALSGGIAYEGLNNAAASDKNIIIVVNDNEMSIAENHGGLYKNLAFLRSNKGSGNNNIFKALGFDYYYVENGNNVKNLVEAFNKVKNSIKPVIVHIHTKKGKGYDEAEKNKEYFHLVPPFDLEINKHINISDKQEDYSTIVGDFLLEKAKLDNSIIAITAGTPYAGNLYKFRDELPKQYMDVGIAEEHSITLASGIVSGGGKPIVNLVSTFIQRTYDQLSHDLAINNNPALIMVYDCGISGSNIGNIGSFDIPLISNIPNITYLAPTSKEELLKMIAWGIEQQSIPVAIRVPNNDVTSSDYEVEDEFYNFKKFIKTKDGSRVCIIALGSFYNLGKNIHSKLKENLGINGTLINPRFITNLDEELLLELLESHEIVITLEDGIINGGFGEKIASFYGSKNIKVLNYGGEKEFTDSIPLHELYLKYRLKEELIIDDITKLLKE